MKTIQAFLKEYDHIPLNEKCMAPLLAEERFLKIKQTMREEHNQPEILKKLLLKLMDDLRFLKGSQQEKKGDGSSKFWNRPLFYFDNDDDEAITPDLPIEEPVDSLIMGDEHFDTIPEKESDELIKSKV
ncbi:hypothetical protein Tco_0131466 [Tanacetum coccineum]